VDESPLQTVPTCGCIWLPGLCEQLAADADADVTGRLEQINIWLPVTSCFGGNRLWVEADYGTADAQPIPVQMGQALLFDGACCPMAPWPMTRSRLR